MLSWVIYADYVKSALMPDQEARYLLTGSSLCAFAGGRPRSRKAASDRAPGTAASLSLQRFRQLHLNCTADS